MADDRARTGWQPPTATPPTFTAPEPIEPAAPPIEYASWWARVGATLLDALVIVAAALVVGIIGAAFGGRHGFAIGFWIGYGLAWLSYAPLMLAYRDGQTVGKQATNIRVINNDGAPIGLGRAWVREVPVKYICGIVPLIDILWPLWEHRNRALHDLAASTLVVKA